MLQYTSDKGIIERLYMMDCGSIQVYYRLLLLQLVNILYHTQFPIDYCSKLLSDLQTHQHHQPI